MNIWINDCSGGGMYVYLVMRGYEVYDEFVSSVPLSWADQRDVASYYAEALGVRSAEE